MNYYIQGNKDRAKEIEAAFEKLGYDTTGWQFNDEGGIYYTFERKKIDLACSKFLTNLIKTHPDYKELELPIEPCFKVGDKIEATIYGIKRRVIIREVDKTNRCYFGTLEECIGFSEQDQWHLAPKPHYDISNFKPFDKVLVRCADDEEWAIEMFSKFYDSEPTIHGRTYRFMCIADSYSQCIPFEGNKHLLGTTDMPSEEYINW